MRRSPVGRSVRLAGAAVAALLLAACGEHPLEPQLGATSRALSTHAIGQIDRTAAPATVDSTALQTPASHHEAASGGEAMAVGPSMPWY